MNIAMTVVTTGLAATAFTGAIHVEPGPRRSTVTLRGTAEHSPTAQHYSRRERGDSSISREPLNLCLSGDTVNSCGEPRDQEDESSGGGSVLTPGMAAEAVSEVAMPGLKLRVQPDGQT